MAGDAAREFYDKALKSRDELTAELEILNAFIELYESFQKKTANHGETDEEQPDLYRPSSGRAAHAARIAEMIDETRRIIVREGRPMKRGELVRRLEERGYEILGGDRNKVFGTNLWRSKKFVMIEGKGYWPKDVPPPS